MLRPWRCLLAVAGAFLCLVSPAHAGVDFQLVPGDYASALAVVAPPGDPRVFVVEQNGAIHVVTDADGKLSPPFLEIDVANDQPEMGLLGLAFDPDYATNGFFYVNYTRRDGAQIQSVISRFHATGDPATSVTADDESEVIKLVVDQPFTNHKGGNLVFGPDGYLYAGFGDGGDANDPGNRAQDLNSLLGKMLRLDVSGDGLATAPPDNPFAGIIPGRDEIWAYGLRNPWRFSFDRDTDDLWIADVGQDDTEEVNFVAGGAGGGQNFGWRAFEGGDCLIPAECLPIGVTATFPIYTYPHGSDSKSITGGFVYRGSALPILQGAYVFADYVAATVGLLRYTPGTTPEVQVKDLTPIFNPNGNVCCISSFGEDDDGELYLVTQTKLYKMVEDGKAYVDMVHVAQVVEPTMVTGPPGDDSRLVILQRNGLMRIVTDGVLSPTPFMDLTDRVASDGELGLIGMTFHPQFATNGFIYVNYMHRTGPGGVDTENKISRFSVIGDPATATTADSSSELNLMTIAQFGGDHNGGAINFSPHDGYLYIPIGDGGCCNDVHHTAQSLAEHLGKILRIDVDHTDPGKNYAVPPSNPFVGQAGIQPEIWAYGIRNPFRSSFDRVTGDFYFGDVGQDLIEEVNFQPASSIGGEDYGWPIFEGRRCNTEVTDEGTCDSQGPGFVSPIKDYPRQFGSSVTGGCVYRGTAIPGLQGRYIYADYISGRVFSFVQSAGVATDERELSLDLDPFDEILQALVGVNEDGVGELYLVSILGNIYKIVQGLGDDSHAGDNGNEGEQTPPSVGIEARVEAVGDATLYEDDAGALANGTGVNFFVGTTAAAGGNAKRRSVISFDVAKALPLDAVIVSAFLRLDCSKAPIGSAEELITLHRVLTPWVEGPTPALGAGGAGAAAKPGDVTWLHTFYNNAFWTNSGGDFDPTVHGSQLVGDTGFYIWDAGQIAEDVEDWVEHPADNHGWLLIGDESVDESARRFFSRETPNAASHPQLVLRYCGSPQDGWTLNPANNHYYRLTEALSYADAAAQADCAGGYLATVNDAAENAWILENMLDASSGYIGYNDRDTEDAFAWINGENPGYENWASGKPDDAIGTEDAVQMSQATGQWDDVSEVLALPGVTERDGSPFTAAAHSADQDGDFVIELPELLRVVQLYNSNGLHCADDPGDTEDGYLPGAGVNQSCGPHHSDYDPADWKISLSELLRLVQLYNEQGFQNCVGSEDGFCAGV